MVKEITTDQHHEQAVEFWNRIRVEEPVIYSSEHILDETATLLARRTSYAWSAEWGRDVLGAGVLFLAIEEGDLLEAFFLMKKFADQAVSFTDCISFVLMKKEGLRDVFGFDRHFASAGFRVWPNSQ